MTYEPNRLGIALAALSQIFKGENKMTSQDTVVIPKAKPITAAIQELKEARKHQAETSRDLRKAEYENRKAVEHSLSLTELITLSINERLSYDQNPSVVTVGESLFVRTATEEGSYYDWLWVLTESVDLPLYKSEVESINGTDYVTLERVSEIINSGIPKP